MRKRRNHQRLSSHLNLLLPKNQRLLLALNQRFGVPPAARDEDLILENGLSQGVREAHLIVTLTKEIDCTEKQNVSIKSIRN